MKNSMITLCLIALSSSMSFAFADTVSCQFDQGKGGQCIEGSDVAGALCTIAQGNLQNTSCKQGNTGSCAYGSGAVIRYYAPQFPATAQGQADAAADCVNYAGKYSASQ
jgi:hypothetical protein